METSPGEEKTSPGEEKTSPGENFIETSGKMEHFSLFGIWQFWDMSTHILFFDIETSPGEEKTSPGEEINSPGEKINSPGEFSLFFWDLAFLGFGIFGI